MHDGPQPGPSPASRQNGPEWQARQRSRERLKVVGLFLLALFILALAFLRFGRTIPWSAR